MNENLKIKEAVCSFIGEQEVQLFGAAEEQDPHWQERLYCPVKI